MNFKPVFRFIAVTAVLSISVEARELNAVGISMGSLGNPYFVTLAKGATARTKELYPDVKVTSLSADYDLSKQYSQIEKLFRTARK